MKSILVIYTGGTIGMVRDKVSGALVPLDFSQVSRHVPELAQAGIRVEAVSFDTPIDSSDVMPKHWRSLALTVAECHDRFDGFVVLHGTDTMAYSASALSFMLQGLRKPVIFTGSQLPIGIPRTDGRENLISALMLAAETFDGEPAIQEVAVYFGNHLMRGNRTHKESAQSLQAIVSPNHPPLVEAGVEFQYQPSALYRPAEAFKVMPQMRQEVAWVSLYPGMPMDLLKQTLEWPDLRGLVLATYGSGNAPTSTLLKDMLAPGPRPRGGHGERHAMRPWRSASRTLCFEPHAWRVWGHAWLRHDDRGGHHQAHARAGFHRRPRRHPRTHDPKPAWRIDASAPHHGPSAWTGRRQWPRF